MKTSVISADFRQRYLSRPGQENICELRAIVFEGPEDYHHNIENPDFNIDANCILVIRNCGPIGYPGSAEVVNMQPPAYLLKQGITSLPTMGDGRQSGTSASSSILNVAPEAAIGGNLRLLQTGDVVHIDLNKRTVDMLVDEGKLEKRSNALKPVVPHNRTPWQKIYRDNVGQLDTGGCMEMALAFSRVSGAPVLSEEELPDNPANPVLRHSH